MIRFLGGRLRTAVGATLIAVSLQSANAGTQLDDGTFLYDAQTPFPESLMALETCGAQPEAFATRRPFAGGFVFSVKCPGNNENFMEALFFASDESGTGGRLLRFHGPGGRRADFDETVANVHWYPATDEIGQIAVDSDPDSRPIPNVCRSEARWRLEGHPPNPELVFWRETEDCAGKSGWKTIVGPGARPILDPAQSASPEPR